MAQEEQKENEREFAIDDHLEEDDAQERSLQERIRERVRTGYLNDETLEQFEEVQELFNKGEPLDENQRQTLEKQKNAHVSIWDEDPAGGVLLGGSFGAAFGGGVGGILGSLLGPAGATAGMYAGAALGGGGVTALSIYESFRGKKTRESAQERLEIDDAFQSYRVVEREDVEHILSTLPEDLDMTRIPTDHWPYDTEDREEALKDLDIIAPEDEAATYLIRVEKVTKDDEDFPRYLRKHDELYRFELEIYTDHVDENGNQLHHPETWVFTGYHTDLSYLEEKDSAKERITELKQFFGDEEEPATFWAPLGGNAYEKQQMYDGTEKQPTERTLLLDPVNRENEEVQNEVQQLNTAYENWLYSEPTSETAEEIAQNTGYTAKGLYVFLQETPLDPENDTEFVNALIENSSDNIIRLPELENDQKLYNIGKHLSNDITLIVEDASGYKGLGAGAQGDVIYLDPPEEYPRNIGSAYAPKDDTQTREYGEPIELERIKKESRLGKYLLKLRK